MNKPGKRLLLAAVLGATLAGALLMAKTPASNVSAQRHPNLVAAQKACAQAYDKITAAQKANEFDMGGHAQRAKDLIDQANQELKLSVKSSNESAAPK